ncbi:hypothetical protein HON22_03825, partial [Candidatus Peregrinibacteria bacterium]|nr:hypothetical protein [Candidatus Peregrinibacteria bacterium]
FLNIQKNSSLEECQKQYENFKNFKHLLVLGIGGSALGTQSILQALGKNTHVTIMDNIDPEEFLKVLDHVDFNNTAINVISKSGGTLETMLQFAVVEKTLKEKFPNDYQKRIICTTGKESLLDNYAKKEGYQTLPVPENVGGRFSVLTAVGIFPMMFAGVDIHNLLKGAQDVSSSILTAKKSNLDKNLEQILELVHIQYSSYIEEKRNICALMSYQKKLMGLLDWHRQLLAESLGKSKSIGITPVLAFGSTDQHSQIQLYTEGPQDKLIFFLSSDITQTDNTYQTLGMNKKISLFQTQEALFEGTKKGIKKFHSPFMELFLNKVDEHEIGKFFTIMMLQIATLGELLNINTYNQPGVEEGKIQAKKILEKIST